MDYKLVYDRHRYIALFVTNFPRYFGISRQKLEYWKHADQNLLYSILITDQHAYWGNRYLFTTWIFHDHVYDYDLTYCNIIVYSWNITFRWKLIDINHDLTVNKKGIHPQHIRDNHSCLLTPPDVHQNRTLTYNP